MDRGGLHPSFTAIYLPVIVHSRRALTTLYTGAYGESWSPRCLLVSVDLIAALGAIRAAQRQSAKNF